MPSRSLRDAFRRVLHAAVLAPVALAGCGVDTTGYTAPLCSGSGLAVDGLAPSVIPDALQLRSVSSYGSPNMREAPFVVSQAGTACATATNQPACASALEALAPTVGFRQSCLQLCMDYHLATTLGDEVKAITSLEGLTSFLGPIDTPQEALLLAFASNYDVSCTQLDRGAVRPSGTGFDLIVTKGFACGEGTALTRHALRVSREGVVTETGAEVIERGSPNCAIGRRPHGLVSSGVSDCDEALGRFFAEAAHLEAASVPAFAQLRAELERHGAPRALRDLALLSALEEVHHTRLTSALARRFGAEPLVPTVEPRAARSLFALALDNATEGCVRETFGALVASHQAQAAGDEAVRSTLGGIAADETRHAELSWAIDAWARAQLSPAERLQLDLAQRAALAALRKELERPVAPALVTGAGLPDPAQAVAMLDAFEKELSLGA